MIRQESTNPVDHKDFHSIADRLSDEFARTVIDRDKRGGTAKKERDALRNSSLLTLSIPLEHGGLGAEWPGVLNIVRQFARTDSSVAHLFGFHHLLLATIDLFGSAEQRDDLFTETVKNRWFWGNALNSVTASTFSLRDGDRHILNGKKMFCSGATDADMLLVSAHEAGNLIVGVVPANREGIIIHQDWDSFGQRQTDSGSVDIDNLIIHERELLKSPGPLGSIRASLRSCLTQLILTNIYLGIAEGAFAEAKEYTSLKSRPWFASGVKHQGEDPYILHNYGNMWVDLQAAIRLTEHASDSFQHCWELGNDITEQERGLCAVDIATAKVFTSRSGLEICSKIFEVTGARATSGTTALDRYWRNLRTHTIHDPIDYKLKELGDWALNSKLPVPGIYS